MNHETSAMNAALSWRLDQGQMLALPARKDYKNYLLF
jgi:hypothetical protein